MKPKFITVHCSATPPSMPNIGVIAIRKMHTDKGWSDIGYHWVIKRDGTIQSGRSMTRSGAGVKGHNKDNIHICMIGGVDDNNKPENNYTEHQFSSLRYLISDLSSTFGVKQENIKGHRDYPNVAKACPCFDVQEKLAEWAGD